MVARASFVGGTRPKRMVGGVHHVFGHTHPRARRLHALHKVLATMREDVGSRGVDG